MWVTELLPWTKKSSTIWLRPQHVHRSDQSRAGHQLDADRQSGDREAVSRFSWMSYGLGSLNENLPSFVVMVARPTNTEQVQAISARLWSSGYLPGEYAATSFRSAGDPILFINNPNGVTTDVRRTTLDGMKRLNELNYQQLGDPEIHTRIQQYELAFRMQSSVPELTDLASEPESTFELYGEASKRAARWPTRCCWLVAWSNAVCDLCRSITTTGILMPTRRSSTGSVSRS
jgi:hypothetical protein